MQARRILVTDFDSTLTRYDFYDLVRKRWPLDPERDPWERYVRGEMTHFDALAEIFVSIPASESELLEIADAMEPAPGLADAVARMRAGGWEIIVASAGCRWYIDYLLKRAGVTLEVHSNPGSYESGKGLKMMPPTDSPFFCRDNGINKAAVVRDAKSRADRIAFAGDGRPDLPAALEVAPEFRFARGWLAGALAEQGEVFHPFDVWREIAEVLCQ